MKAVVQRVESAKLSVADKTVSEIGLGLVVYLGIEQSDTAAFILPLAKKLAALRIFSDDNGKMNLSVRDKCGSILIVSQFTLCADTSHGNRPSFTTAMNPADAEKLYLEFARVLNEQVPVKTGVFGADMTIDQVNSGPVTIIF